MNVKIGAEATLFPEKEYINGIAVAVYSNLLHLLKGMSANVSIMSSKICV